MLGTKYLQLVSIFFFFFAVQCSTKRTKNPVLDRTPVLVTSYLDLRVRYMFMYSSAALKPVLDRSPVLGAELLGMRVEYVFLYSTALKGL